MMRLVEAEPSGVRFVYEALPSDDMPAANLKTYRATVLLRPLGDKRTEIDRCGGGDIERPPPATIAAFAELYARAVETSSEPSRLPTPADA